MRDYRERRNCFMRLNILIFLFEIAIKIKYDTSHVRMLYVYEMYIVIDKYTLYSVVKDTQNK